MKAQKITLIYQSGTLLKRKQSLKQFNIIQLKLRQYSSTTTLYCNSYTYKLNMVHKFKVYKDAIEDHQTIKGVGVVVEVDETHLISKTKYHVGRDVTTEHMWAFGGIEKHTGRRFCVSLGLGGSRSMPKQPNVQPLVKKHIRKGSIITSDCWPGYNNTSNLVDTNGASMDYCHYNINHSISFVNISNYWVHT